MPAKYQLKKCVHTICQFEMILSVDRHVEHFLSLFDTKCGLFFRLFLDVFSAKTIFHESELRSENYGKLE